MPLQRYENFDLLIGRRSNGYAVSVIRSPAGETTQSHPFSLPFSQEQFNHPLKLIGGTVAGEPNPLDPKTFGVRLFQAVFGDQVNLLLHRSLTLVEQQGVGLRIRLRLTETPELAALPWEYLYDPDSRRFLALSEATPLVRYLHVPQVEAPLAVESPLRILVVMADPRDVAPRLNVKAEWTRLRQAVSGLQKARKVVVERLKRATLAQLQSRLRQSEPVHILHFIGHGFYEEDTQSGGLLLEDTSNNSHLVSAEQLSVLLNDAVALRLLFLNACDGARGAQSEPFSGTAQYLVQQGLPAVIAMQFAVSDQAATALAQEFYQALADHLPVDGALAAGRKALFVHGSVMEWGIPVLFMRAPDGQLFAPAAAPAPASPAEATNPAQSKVTVNVATDGGTISHSSIKIGNIAGDDIKA